MNILYLYGFSEMTGNHLERLLPIIKSQLRKGTQIGVALIHDGVIGINKNGKTPDAMKQLYELDVNLFAMGPDLKARGINPEYINEKIKPIDYEQLVDVIDNTPKIVSWM